MSEQIHTLFEKKLALISPKKLVKLAMERDLTQFQEMFLLMV